VVGGADQQRLDDPLPVGGGLNLGVDVHVIEEDQTAAAPVGVHDAVLIHRPGDGMDQEGGEGQVLTGCLALPQQPVGVCDVDLDQPVDDVLSLGGLEEVGVAPANLQERSGLIPAPTCSRGIGFPLYLGLLPARIGNVVRIHQFVFTFLSRSMPMSFNRCD